MYYSTPKLFAAFATISISSAIPLAGNSHSHQIGERISRRETQAQYVAYAQAGIDQLQTWYTASTGLWSNYWWNSANAITMLADFQDFFPALAIPTTSLVFPTTLAQAPNTNAGFLNGFYDDELWWVLAWIKVYDVTGDITYLNTAAEIFEDPKSAWGDEAACGGLW